MLGALLDLVLPVACAGCRLSGSRWCRACALATVPEPRYVRPSPCPPGFPVTAGAADYADVVRAALLAHKERGARAARPALAHLLVGAVELVAAEGAVVLVPIPSSPAAVRSRGGDPVRAMTEASARLLGPRARVATGLRQVRTPGDQAGMTAGERLANLDGVLHASASALAGGRVVIVDDVCTTGATLREAARAIQAAGCVAPVAAVVAATVLRGPA